MLEPISVPSTFEETWSPHLIASVDSTYIKIVKVDGTFIWHAHPESDELFYHVRDDLTLEVDGEATGGGATDGGATDGEATDEAKGEADVRQKDDREDTEEGRLTFVRKVEMKPGDVFVMPKGVKH